MSILDLIFYTSWAYLTGLIFVEILLFDFPAVLPPKGQKSHDVQLSKSINYYSGRQAIALYKITPVFCLGISIAIIANIINGYADHLVSAIIILGLSIVLIIVQTQKNVSVAVGLKTVEASDSVGKFESIKSIFIAHLVTMMLLAGIMGCYLFKF